MSHDRIAKAFDGWVESGFADGMEKDHGDVVAQVIESLQVKPGERILELGCGLGWATRKLAQLGPGVQAIGVDASPKMVAKAEAGSSLTIRARYEVCPFEALDFPDAHFDRAFSMEALYYAADLDAALTELHRVLKPGTAADVVLNFFTENAGTEAWRTHIDTEMIRLSEDEWKQRFQAAGFAEVTTQRVVDRRGPGDEAAFRPSKWCDSWETQRAIHAAGSLWIHARKG